MKDKIRISPNEMRNRATEYRTEAGNIESVIRQLDKLLAQLEDEWEGKASQKFSEQYTKLRPAFVNGKTLVNVIASQLDQVAKAMENLDTGLAGQFGKDR